MSASFHPLRVRSVEPETPEAVVVAFDVPPAWRDLYRFTQGQYLTVRADVDGRDLRRSYSICSGIDDPLLRIGVRRVRDGVFSTWLNTRVRPGDVLQVMVPQGRFHVPLAPTQARRYLGIAGGSGITPVLSILKTVLAREPHARFTLVYGNRSAQSTMFREELEDLKNRHLSRLALHFVFSDDVVDLPLHAGVLDRERVAGILPLLLRAGPIDHAFVCGPFAMNDEAEAALLAAGVAPDRIHIERFGVPPDAAAVADAVVHRREPGDAEQATVELWRDGVRREFVVRADAPSVLDAAIAAGIEMPYSCTSGVCGTCRARLLEGKVRMARHHALDQTDLAAGFVLACQSHPLTERLVLSFDDR